MEEKIDLHGRRVYAVIQPTLKNSSYGIGIAMIFYKEERLALFIDGANLYAAARSLGFDIDYKRLLELFAKKGRMIRAFYYTMLVEDQEYSPIRPLIDWLDYNGYTMVTKPIKEFSDSQGRRKAKGSVDIDLAVDALEMTDKVDHILLFSGDGDFRRLVEAIQRKGVRVTVVSTVKAHPPMVADDLRRAADNFIELQELAPHIRRSAPPAQRSDTEYVETTAVADLEDEDLDDEDLDEGELEDDDLEGEGEAAYYRTA